MDPVKKTFSESFADFELPVREDLWQQVRHKRRPTRRVLPLYRRVPTVAAAAAVLLGVAVWFLWPTISLEDPVPLMAGRDSSIRSGQTEGVIRPARSDDQAAIVAPVEEAVTKPRSHNAQHPARSGHTQIAVASVPASDALLAAASSRTAEIESVQEAEWMDYREASLLMGPDLALTPDELPSVPEPIHIQAPEPVMPRQPGVRSELAEVRKRPNLRPSGLKPLLREGDMTGPERLMAALESFRPRVVDDLIALGSRRTEIEISW